MIWRLDLNHGLSLVDAEQYPNDVVLREIALGILKHEHHVRGCFCGVFRYPRGLCHLHSHLDILRQELVRMDPEWACHYLPDHVGLFRPEDVAARKKRNIERDGDHTGAF